jgi:hypothetical protein
MRSLAFAWRRLVRQPGRAVLGILGVAAVGALLFDMLLLSRGLVVSLADQLDRVGFDIRVTAGDGLPIVGERIQRASEQVALVAGLAEVEAVAAMEVARGWVLWPDARMGLTLVGGTPGRHAGWRLVEGRDLDEVTGPYPGVVVSRSVLTDYVPALDRTMTARIGELLTLRGDCLDGVSAVLPVTFEIVGVGEFPFDGESSRLAAVTPPDLAEVCGEVFSDEADVLLVASRKGFGAEAATRAVGEALPELNVFSNSDLLDQFQEVGFSYFRQISTVLATVTLFFGFLLITALLTVSVNQRVAEIATLRAIGFPQRRIVADLAYESAMLVGAGGLLALPAGGVLAVVLDDILLSMPGLPEGLHFFVYETRAVVIYGGLLAVTAALAAVYPARLAIRLPIAATLRDAVVS